MELLEAVDQEISRAISAELGDDETHDPLVRRSDFADLQANFALALARRLRMPLCQRSPVRRTSQR